MPPKRATMLIDIHTHIYTPRLVSLLRARTTNPRIYTPLQTSSDYSANAAAPAVPSEMLAILPEEPAGGGRPVGPQYWSRASKLAFMDRHRIDASVVSVANPWLDWMMDDHLHAVSSSNSAADTVRGYTDQAWEEGVRDIIKVAKEANEDLVSFCLGDSPSTTPESPQSQAPSSSSDSVGITISPGVAKPKFTPALPQNQRLRAFGILPFAQGVPVEALLQVVDQIASYSYSSSSFSTEHTKGRVLCGAILGTRGLGAGLDDPQLEPFWSRVEASGLTLFLHPHYGIGGSGKNAIDSPDGLFGGMRKDANGHILPLALGFPYETAAATARLILAGILDRYPNLRILLAHSGGALPLLSSRLASCITHESSQSPARQRLQHDARYYLGKLFYDAVAYGPEELYAAASIVGRAERYRRGGSGVGGTPRSIEKAAQEAREGSRRFVFGTDHPFFPPVEEEHTEMSDEQILWRSVTENLASLAAVPGWGEAEREGVMSENARRILGLDI
ncbi:amidohydrolase 2 [Tilletiaria anomala UBC 951]|uniref:Amidohydrolase 2 n=1 Tax=Tilletiaria anomala (strain ATCC 24038 / CBS 436.72 / UBC 951) TaxID=1037660 RepID=A0A066W9M5_TILAU|nr:amidohydrolase 2 [Tilletiaria anomala UBC 951]KDN49248.1 amidohydrolase 2 [Tilletiaria anomala UBC 951]